MNASNWLHAGIALVAYIALAFLLSPLCSATIVSVYFWSREQRSFQRTREKRGIGKANVFMVRDLAPGVAPFDLDNLLDWVVAAIVSWIGYTVSVIVMTYYR